MKSPAITLAVAYAVLVALLVLCLIASNALNIPVRWFMIDPAATYKGHPFAGIFSYLGVLLWFSAGSICLFSFFYQHRNKERSSFLLYSGLLSLLLALDDLFMLHETVIPKYLHIRERYVFVGYLLLTFSWFISFKNRIWNSEYKILTIAIVFLGLSVFCDFILPGGGISYLFEDGLKLFGIATWLIYFARVSSNEIANATNI